MNSKTHNTREMHKMNFGRLIPVAVAIAIFMSFLSCGGGGSTFIELNPSESMQAPQQNHVIPITAPEGNIGEVPQGEFPSFPVPSTEKFTARADFPIAFNGNDQYEAVEKRGWTRKCAEAVPEGNGLRVTPTAGSYIGWVEYRIGDADGEQLNYLTVTDGSDEGDTYYILVANWTTSEWDMYGPKNADEYTINPTEFEEISGNADYSEDYISSGGDFYWCLIAFYEQSKLIASWGLEGETDDLLPPINVAATDGDHHDFIQVSWTPVITLTEPDEYQVYRSSPADYNDYQTVGTPVEHTSTGTHTFNDDQVTNGDTYRYKVQALEGSHADSSLSSYDEGYLTQLGSPTAVDATDGTEVGQITIGWAPPEGEPAPVTYEVFRDAAQDGAFTYSVGTTTDATPSLIYTFDSDVEYWFKVRSRNPAYDDSPIDGQTANQGQSMPLQAPEALLAGDGTSDANIPLFWEPPASGPDPQQYEVWWNTAETGVYTLRYNTPSDETSWEDENTDPGSHHWYKVLAVRGAPGEYVDSPYSNANEGYRGADLLPPDSPAATDGDHVDKIRVSWEHPSGEEPEGYYIWRATEQGGDYGAGPVFTTNFVTSQDDPLANLPDPVGATYWYKIQSFKEEFDDSGFTSEVSGYVTQLQQPGNIQATDETLVDQITVTWDAHSSGPDPENFKILRADEEDGNYVLQGETGDATRSYTQTVSTGIPLWYKVVSQKTGYVETPLEGQQANDGRVMQPQPPTGVTASDGTEVYQTVVSWTPPEEGNGPAPDHYEIWTDVEESGDYTTYLADTPNATPSYTHNVSAGATVWYKVKSAIDSTYDTSDITAQDPDSGYPWQLEEPSAISASEGTNADNVEVAWNTPGNGPAPDGYKIWRRLTENGDYDDLGNDGESPYFDESAAARTGTTYWYKVESLLTDYDPSGYSTQQADDGWVGLSPPSEVAATQGDHSDMINVTWELPAMGPTDCIYDLYRSTDPNTGFTVLISDLDALVHPDYDVTDGSSRYYKLISKKSGYDDSDFSEVAEGWLTGPAPPSGIDASDGTYAGETRVTFTPPAGEPSPDSYQLMRCLEVDGEYVDVGTPDDVLPLVDDNETGGETVYYYKVKSLRTGYNPSTPSTDSDAGHKMPMQEPATLTASDDVAAHIEIDWDVAGTGPAADAFVVYESTTSGNLGEPIHTTSDGTTTYYEHDPGNFDTFYYTVIATNEDYEDSPETNRDAGRRLPIPDMPSTVNASDGSSTGYITVSCATSTGATMYQFWRSDTENGTYTQKSGDEDTNSWNDTSATPGQIYWYKAKAGNGAGFSDLSTAKDDGWRKLSPPNSISASDGTYYDKIRISWQDNVPGAEEYKIYRAESSSGPYDTPIDVEVDSPYDDDDSGLVPGDYYYYKIRSSCPLGHSELSDYNRGYIAEPLTYWETESNDSQGSADQMSVPFAPNPGGEDFTGAIPAGDSGDLDWYTFTTTEIGQIFVVVDCEISGSGTELYFTLYDDHGESEGSKTLDQNNNQKTIATSYEYPHVFHIKVHANSDELDYDVTVVFEAHGGTIDGQCRDAGNGVGGVTVQLLNSGGTVIDEFSTYGGSGYYQFTEVQEGDYGIKVLPQGDWNSESYWGYQNPVWVNMPDDHTDSDNARIKIDFDYIGN